MPRVKKRAQLWSLWENLANVLLAKCLCQQDERLALRVLSCSRCSWISLNKRHLFKNILMEVFKIDSPLESEHVWKCLYLKWGSQLHEIEMHVFLSLLFLISKMFLFCHQKHLIFVFVPVDKKRKQVHRKNPEQFTCLQSCPRTLWRPFPVEGCFLLQRAPIINWVSRKGFPNQEDNCLVSWYFWAASKNTRPKVWADQGVIKRRCAVALQFGELLSSTQGEGKEDRNWFPLLIASAA